MASSKNTDSSTSLTAIFLMVFSSALLLLLIGLYLVIGLHSDNIVRFLKEHTAIVFELSEGVEPEGIDVLVERLKSDDRLRSHSVTYISSESGLEFMREEMGPDLLPVEMDNPFSDLISSYVKEAHTSDEALALIQDEWQLDELVSTVYFQNDYLTFWGEWKGRIARVTGFSALTLLLMTVMLIFNTVKLSILTRRDSIEILELVGAEWTFIRAPFLRVAVKMGVISALLASIFIALILSILLFRTPGLIDYFNWYYMVSTIAVLIVLGVFLQWMSTYIVVNRSLRETVSTYK